MAQGDLCTLQDVRLVMEATQSETARDQLITSYITAASFEINRRARCEFATTVANPATRRFAVHGLKVSLCPYSLQTATVVTLNPEDGGSAITLAATTDYLLKPVGAPYGVYDTLDISVFSIFGTFSNTAYKFGHALLDITGTWGFPTVPPDVANACAITVASWLRTDMSGMALDLAGDARDLAPQQFSTYSIPPAAMKKLRPFMDLNLV